jgi:hypothetical protein
MFVIFNTLQYVLHHINVIMVFHHISVASIKLSS